MLKALIFNYDGVVVESDSYNRHGITNAAQRLGLPFDEQSYAQFFANKPLEIGASMYLTFIHKPELKDELIALKKMYDKEYAFDMDIVQSTLFFMDRTKQFYKFALIADAPRGNIEHAMQRVKRHYLFDVFVGEEDYERPKPAPDVYTAALSKLEIAPEEAMAFEDSPLGVQAATEAGVPCIAVTHTFTRDVLNEADMVVDTLAEVSDDLLEALAL